MWIDTTSVTPGLSLTGGLLIGAAAAVPVLFNGRIAGISGILGGPLGASQKDAGWHVAFLAGLIVAPVLAGLLGNPTAPDIAAGWTEILVAGFLVGIGTRYASGCTSGPGVCGISRSSVRSLVATATFMASGFLTVFVSRHLVGGLANPAKVLAFVDLAGSWDPSLAFVMAGAIAVGSIAFLFGKRREKSLLGLPMPIPASTVVTLRLVLGSAVFGVGRGLAGFCAGPALVALGAGFPKAWGFVAAMLCGMTVFELLERR
jgi:uncharacterized protein